MAQLATDGRIMAMDAPDVAGLQRIAAECVALVATEYDRHLDWSLDSLVELDAVCGSLLADGPLAQQRLDLWRKLVEADTGEVLVRSYEGQRTTHEGAPGTPVAAASGVTAFPFGVADRGTAR